MKNKKTRPIGIKDNPTGEDFRCECCLRHIDELKPFKGPEAPYIGNLKGYKLVRTGRCDFPEYELPSKYSDYVIKGRINDEQKFIEKFGQAEFNIVYSGLGGAFDIVSKYLLCRDCFLLDREQFCEKCHESYEKHKREKIIDGDKMVNTS